MFNKLKEMFTNADRTGIVVLAPVKGEVVPVTQVSDPTFGEEILGKGVAIKPAGNRVVAPVDGTVEQMFETGHAVSLVSEGGAEILIHVGLDTIKLGGEHFKIHAHAGDKVKTGDVLIEFDREKIQQAGYDTITPVIVCNTADYASVETHTDTQGNELDRLIVCKK